SVRARASRIRTRVGSPRTLKVSASAAADSSSSRRSFTATYERMLICAMVSENVRGLGDWGTKGLGDYDSRKPQVARHHSVRSPPGPPAPSRERSERLEHRLVIGLVASVVQHLAVADDAVLVDDEH